MSNESRKLTAVLIAIGLVLIVSCAWIWIKPTSDPNLTVTYLTTIDKTGHWIARFGITNTGGTRVFTAILGRIEILDHPKLLSVAARTPMSKLSPGEGQVVDVILSDSTKASINGKWRYTCLYAPVGLRSIIYNWQWGTNGPGARVNWLIPQRLKGMPLTVKGTSGWIDALQ